MGSEETVRKRLKIDNDAQKMEDVENLESQKDLWEKAVPFGKLENMCNFFKLVVDNKFLMDNIIFSSISGCSSMVFTGIFFQLNMI